MRNSGRQTCTEEVSQCTTLRNHLTSSSNCSTAGLQQAQNNSSCLKLLSYIPMGSRLYRLKHLQNTSFLCVQLGLELAQNSPEISRDQHQTELRFAAPAEPAPDLTSSLHPADVLCVTCVTHGCDNPFPCLPGKNNTILSQHK